ncbi:unnamed protein product [Polarella glacialis]|uniref:50S ribosomal protein L35 n=1 Tax=Polarella glacialis TaxID=89957 RepID=A0A813E280_POLGL|nr:unnamed protein product [Polarella glacialis]
MSKAVRRQLPAAGLVLAGCCLLQLACLRGSAFLQLAPTVGPQGLPMPAPRAFAKPASSIPTSAGRISAGSAFLWAATLGAAAAAARAARSRTGSGTLTGSGSAQVIASNLLVAQLGDAVDSESLITMGQVPRRPHVRISERGFKEWSRGHRQNSAAKKRFLVKPDGTIWRRQCGLRHLKSKKLPAHLKHLKRMVRITRGQYKRVQSLLHIHIKSPLSSDFIMRKFAECRAKDHLGTSDRGVGTAMFC